MDVTNVFKACVKTAKTRKRALGEVVQSNNILPKVAKRCGFSSKAKDIVSNISKLRDFIMEHRKAYINVEHLSNSSGMRDIERDQIDADAQSVMRTCSQILREFKQDVLQQTCTAQQKEHREAVLHLIEEYLKVVCQTHSEQMAIRVKRAIDKQKMLRLEPNQSNVKAAATGVADNEKQTAEIDQSHLRSIDQFSMDEDDSDAPSAEEIQMFEQENQRLYDELSTVADEVKLIEGQVMEISKLQDIFTSKVLQQDHDLDRVTDTVIHTTENIKTANEDIREAMKKNASFRAWLLFFLIVMAFSLLFLDWYNP